MKHEDDSMIILAISGSLRSGSLNTAVLRTLQHRAPGGTQIDMADLKRIPLYDDDIESEQLPDSVTVFKSAIQAADALIIATPEYNYSVTGVLKNAIDWASRPAYQSVLKGKVVGIVSASPAFTGGVRAQQHLKTILSGTLSRVVNHPEVLVASAHKVIEDGLVTDQRTLGQLDGLFNAVIETAQLGQHNTESSK
jgi:chromate reductase